MTETEARELSLAIVRSTEHGWRSELVTRRRTLHADLSQLMQNQIYDQATINSANLKQDCKAKILETTSDAELHTLGAARETTRRELCTI